MNAKFIKNVYNNLLPAFIKDAMGGIIRKKLIGNNVFLDTYGELVEVEKWSDEKLKEKQLELLKKTCILAYENIPFYKKEFDEVGFDLIISNRSKSSLLKCPR